MLEKIENKKKLYKVDDKHPFGVNKDGHTGGKKPKTKNQKPKKVK
jgi:hypothetical protein